ncbi:DUF3244 domain-containing protein [Bacteroides sp.]|uniref:DUF3244 domain-containing protein n=1 Tax=Bacteroides sp. TaxID=29523 RepID=UPI002FC7B4EC
MKKIVLLVALLIGQMSFYVQGASMKAEADREIPLKAMKPGQPGSIARSIIQKPAIGRICDGVLTIDFLSPVSSITITLTNLLTGKIVYWDAFEMAGNVVIDLTSEESGTYQVNLNSPHWCLQGQFDL